MFCSGPRRLRVPGEVRMALNAGYGQIIGQIGMLFTVILIIRVLPEGISSVLVRRGRWRES